MASSLHDPATRAMTTCSPLESVNILPVYLEIDSSWEKTIIERPTALAPQSGEGGEGPVCERVHRGPSSTVLTAGPPSPRERGEGFFLT